MNIEEDFNYPIKRSLDDIAELCMKFNVNPSSSAENLCELLETQLKEVIFEHNYLNEKVAKRNQKLKNILHPML